MFIRELEQLENLLEPWREVDRFNRSAFRNLSPGLVEFPPVNLWKNEDKAVITTEIPGVDLGGVEINVVGTTISLRFERKREELNEGESYTRNERWYGEFSRTIELPFNVQVDKVSAKFSKGILYIEMPRAEAEKPRKITVQAE
jgi:HSP20 family protein